MLPLIVICSSNLVLSAATVGYCHLLGHPFAHMSSPSRKRARLFKDAAGSEEKTISFSDAFGDDSSSLWLMEVSDELLAELGKSLDTGDIRFIGRDVQDAVLVTANHTYSVTRVETSNTLLLVAPGSDEEEHLQVSASLGAHFELARVGGLNLTNLTVSASRSHLSISCPSSRQITPPMEQLKAYLAQHEYKGCSGPGKEDDRGALGAATLSELEGLVQFSRGELVDALHELGALEINGKWRTLEQGLRDRVLDSLLEVIVEQDLPLEALVVKDLISALDSHEPFVVEQCLKLYSEPKVPTANSDQLPGPCLTSDIYRCTYHQLTLQGDEGCRSLDLSKIAVLRAHELLSKRCAILKRTLLHWQDFLTTWSSSIPGSSPPQEELLKGIAFKETSTELVVECLRYAPANQMPFEPRGRLEALFSLKPRWPLEELEPYLRLEGVSIAGMLLKLTRNTTDANGTKVYCAR
ncbi:unnamed protein product [Chrysoparadoxa australica]